MTAAHARALLGVGPAATAAQIEAAFRLLAWEAHPDRGGSTAAFGELTEARGTLLGRFGPHPGGPRVSRPSVPHRATAVPVEVVSDGRMLRSRLEATLRRWLHRRVGRNLS